MPLSTLEPDQDKYSPGDKHWDNDRFEGITGSKDLQDFEKSMDDTYGDSFGKLDAKEDGGAAARAGEQTGGAWADNTTKQKALPGVGGARGALNKGKAFIKKKGAIAAIIALMGGGGLVPFLAAGSLPFSIIGNMDAKSMLLGLDQYNKDFLGFRIFGPNKASVQNGAKGKLSGLTEKEILQLEKNGVTLEGKGKPNALTGRTTFTGVRYQNGPVIKAGSEFTTEMRKNPAFRKAMVYTKKSGYWKASKGILGGSRAKGLFRINPNPDISGEDKKARDKKMYQTSMDGSSSSVNSKTGDSDGDGNPDDKGELKGIAEDAQEQIEANKKAFEEGNFDGNHAANSDMGNIATQLDREVVDVAGAKNLGSKILSFVNPLDAFDMICTTYQVAHTAEVIARTVALANIVRFAMSIRAVIERAKAGDDDGEAVKYLMEMIQQKDPQTGRSFDATSYATMLFTGKLSSEPSSVSAFGGQAMVALMMGMHSVHAAVGKLTGGGAAEGRQTLRTGCNIVTNLGVQIAATAVSVVLSFFTGGGAAAAIKGAGAGIKGAFSVVQKKVAESVVKKFGKEAIERQLKNISEQGALKYFARDAWKGFKNTWNSFGGLEKAGFMLAAVSTFALPYIVNVLSGGDIVGFIQNGVTAFDALGTGFDRYEYTAGIGAGGSVATYATAAAYQKTQDEYEAQYIADRKYEAKDTPLDINNQYSTLGAAVFSMQQLVGVSASMNIFSTLRSVASLPLKLPGLGAVASAEDGEPTPEAIGEKIGDTFSQENKIALTVTGTPRIVFNKTMSFEQFVDKFVDSDNAMVAYGGDDKETGEPLFSINPGSDLDVYSRKCHDPEKSELDPEYASDDSVNYREECIDDANPEFDDALRFINQLSPDAATSSPGSPSDGPVSAGGFAWPFSEEDYKKNEGDYLGAHIQTGTAWGSDNMGTSGKGAYIATDIGKAAGTPVHAMFGGTVTSVSLCGANDGIAIKSDVNGKTLGIAYMHGDNQKFKVGDTVKAGDVIMNVGTRGCNVYGAHLHIGIAYEGQYLCPQDVFLAAAAGTTTFDFSGMVKKAAGRCGR